MTAKNPNARPKAPDGAGLAFFETAMLSDTPECIDWPYGTTEGYGRVWVDGKAKHTHVMACEREHGPKPKHLDDAAHSCHRRICINRRHVRWATRQENVDDMMAKDGHWTHR